MPTLQQHIADKFITSLSVTKGLEDERIERLRALLSSGKKIKPDELVKIFVEPSGEDVK
jgi:hypothetical protein